MSVGGRKKSKSVRMSVDFSSAAEDDALYGQNDPTTVVNHDHGAVPTFVVSNGDPAKGEGVSNGSLVTGGGGCGGKFTLGETDPLLIMAASYFVQELLYKAQIEAQRRLAKGVQVKKSMRNNHMLLDLHIRVLFTLILLAVSSYSKCSKIMLFRESIFELCWSIDCYRAKKNVCK